MNYDNSCSGNGKRSYDSIPDLGQSDRELCGCFKEINLDRDQGSPLKKKKIKSSFSGHHTCHYSWKIKIKIQYKCEIPRTIFVRPCVTIFELKAAIIKLFLLEGPFLELKFNNILMSDESTLCDVGFYDDCIVFIFQ